MIETEDEVFNEMISQFNFYKVREVMRFLDWKWWTNPNDVPTVTEMKVSVYQLYLSAKNSSSKKGKPVSVSSGGFTVTVDRKNHTAILQFVIEESTSGFY